ncbi:hypothetical protein [Flavobacterium sp.]|jgi:hypothetical protein|uniref:hypothetical protein n=1 Tax=Flavobacterium sp. TaxID=239 RepID=UPI0037C12D48
MENEKEIENFENNLTSAAVGFLQESAKWSKFMAIIGFIGIGLMVLVSLFMAIGFSAMGASTMPVLPFSMSVFSIIYVLFAAIYFFPVYYLYQYATKTSAALHSKNKQLLADGLENLKSHHKFLGIFTLIIISLYGFIFVFAILEGILSTLS